MARHKAAIDKGKGRDGHLLTVTLLTGLDSLLLSRLLPSLQGPY